MGGRKISIFCGISLNRCGILRSIRIMGGVEDTILKTIYAIIPYHRIHGQNRQKDKEIQR